MFNNLIINKILALLLSAITLTLMFVYFENNTRTLSFKLDNKTLNTQTVKVLDNLDSVLKLDIYSSQNSIISKKVIKFIKPFQLIKNNFDVEVIDPIQNPSLVRQNAITIDGEMVLTYLDKSVHITELSESALVNAILSLQRTEDKWLIIAEGYDMLSVADDQESGLFKLLVYLQKIGVKVARMPLNNSLELPDNVKVILLPRPKKTIEADMVQWLQKQMNQGISIWWLTDPDVQNSQNYLELLFDVMIGDKQIINADKYNGSLSSYLNHSITDKFNQPIYIAESAEIITDSFQKVINTINDNSIMVAKILENSRLLISGDVDLITNQYLNLAANKNLIVRSLDWLFQHDDRINFAVSVKSDTQLNLSNTQILILSLSLLLMIPVFYLIIAFIQWRRASA